MRLTPRRSLGAATTCQEDRYTNGVGQRRPSASTPRRWKPSASTPRRWRPSATTTHRFQEAATQTLPELGRERPEGVASKVGDPTHCPCHPARGSPGGAPLSLPLAGGQRVNAGDSDDRYMVPNAARIGRERPEDVASKVCLTHCLCHVARGSPKNGTGFRDTFILALGRGPRGQCRISDVAGIDHPTHPGTVITTSPV
jgi:hypothetical protein